MKNYFLDHRLSLLLIASFIVVNLTGLMSVGPEYDEVLVANAALNCPSNTFIEHTFWVGKNCYPLMLSAYIGGIMALPYRILFSITGANILTFRMIGVSIFAFSLFLIYFSLKKTFDRKIALIVSSLLITDFQLWFNVRFERTTVVPLLIKSIWFYFAARLIEEKNIKYSLIIGVCSGLMIWAKFDAVFFFVSIVAAAIFVNFRNFFDLVKIIKTELKFLVVFFAGFVIGLLPLLVYLSQSWQHFIFIGKNIAKTDLIGNLITKTSLIFWQFSNFDGIWYVFKVRPSLNAIIVILTLIVWLYLLKFAFWRKNKFEKFLYIAVILFWLIFLLFGGLRFSHHRYLIYPIPQLLFAMYLVTQDKKSQIIFYLSWIFIFIFSFFISMKLSMSGGAGAFASNILNLSNELRSRTLTNEKVLVGDWGIANQLILMNGGSFKVNEIAFLANAEDSGMTSVSLQRELNNCDFLILRREPKAIFKNADNNLRSIFSGNMVYTDQEFELYECKNETKHN